MNSPKKPDSLKREQFDYRGAHGTRSLQLHYTAVKQGGQWKAGKAAATLFKTCAFSNLPVKPIMLHGQFLSRALFFPTVLSGGSS
ncbi:hypothetical protein [Neisseria sp.]|uniref:hypothetical protein n=1 Tax=Neisseria sp. TaxID=192066 RepID=UPI0026DBDB16|nr:hypothetical protein [Neisseria sp.]MDO4907845.1 hypothetical protein [Neisseria sp.]